MARIPKWVGGTVAVGCALAYLAVLAVALATEQAGEGLFVTLLLGYPMVGAIIVAKQPQNAIGWLLVIGGASIALGQLTGAIVLATVDANPVLWQAVLAWLTNLLFIGGFEGLVIAMAFLFPTGRTLSPAWRVASIAVALTMTLSYAVLAFRPGSVNGYFSGTPQLANPLGIPGIDSFTDWVGTSSLVVLQLFAAVTILAAVVARVRRSRGIERLQLRWFALALMLVIGPLLLMAFVAAFLPDQSDWVNAIGEPLFFLAATLGVSAAIGIAILRYNLYDIDRIITRTLVYSSVTLSLLAVYLVSVYVLSSLMRAIFGESSQLVVALSTLAAAALFRPFLLRIQSIVDRRFYRRKYDAARTLEAFSERLRDELDLRSLSSDLQAVVDQTMQPEHVSLWLRPTVATHRSRTTDQ